MNRKKLGVALACALVGAVAIYVVLFRASDEDQIRKCLTTFASIVTVKPNDTILSRTARMRSRLPEVLGDDVHVTVADLGLDVSGRDVVADAAAKAGVAYNDASFAFVGTKIEIDPAKTFAKVDTTAILTAKVGEDERQVDKRDVHVLLRKDGHWHIDTLEVLTPRRDDGPTSP